MIRINLKGIQIFIISFIFFSDNFFAGLDNIIPIISVLRIVPIIVGFFSFLLLEEKSKFSLVMFWCLLWMIFISGINDQIFEQSTFQILRYVFMAFTLEYNFKTNRKEIFCNSFFIASVFCMLLNLLINPTKYGLFLDVYDSSKVLYYGRAMWYIGYRNTFGEFFVLSTVVLLMGNREKEYIKVVGYIWVLVGILMSLYVFSMSSIIILLVFLLGLIFINSYKLSILQSILPSIVCSILVICYDFHVLFANIISNVLHRNFSLFERVRIWKYYCSNLFKSFISLVFGNGSYACYIPVLGKSMSAHNIWLEILFSYGIVGGVGVSFIFLLAFMKKRKYMKTDAYKILSLSLLVMSIRGIFEASYAFLFIILVLISNLSLIERKKGNA